jgi:very-short-patch-repair endonuclease
VIMADSALRLRDVTLIELKIAASQRRRGAPRLRQVIALLDSRSESPWESVLRVLHCVADIPVEPQHVIVDSTDGSWPRADLWIKGTRRIHEYDGAVHREAEVHQRDLKRERNLIMSDWQRFDFTSAHILNEGAAISRSVDDLLGRPWIAGGWRLGRSSLVSQCFGDEAVHELSQSGLARLSHPLAPKVVTNDTPTADLVSYSTTFRERKGKARPRVRHSSRGARAWPAFRAAPESAAPSPGRLRR